MIVSVRDVLSCMMLVGVLCVFWFVFDHNMREVLEVRSEQCKAILAITQQSFGQRCRPPALRKVIKSMRNLHI